MEHVLMKRFDDELWIKYDYFYEKFEQLATVTAERDELVSAMGALRESEKVRCTCSSFVIQYEGGCCCESGKGKFAAKKILEAALAKLGADKGEV